VRDQDRAGRLSQHAIDVGSKQRAHAKTGTMRAEADEIYRLLLRVVQDFRVG
jgi:hypothetical protein